MAVCTVSSLTTCRIELAVNDFSSTLQIRDHESNSFAFFDISCLASLSICDKGDLGMHVFLRTKCSSSEDIVYRVTAIVGIRKADGSVGALNYETLRILANGNQLVAVLRKSLWNKMERWVPNGILTVIFNFTLEDDPGTKAASQESLEGKNYPMLVKNLEDLLLSEREADVTLRVLDQQFKAHKAILVARSPVFALMFESDMAEKLNSAVKIEDCDPYIFQDFLRYLYTGKDCCVPPSKAADLYRIADKYNVQELKLLCVQRMRNDLSLDYFCDVISIASLYDESELLKTATDFFIKHFKDILRTEKWAEFHAMHTKLVGELLLKLADGISM